MKSTRKSRVSLTSIPGQFLSRFRNLDEHAHKVVFFLQFSSYRPFCARERAPWGQNLIKFHNLIVAFNPFDNNFMIILMIHTKQQHNNNEN